MKNIPTVKAMDFPIIMYRCDSWTIKKADHHRIDALKKLLFFFYFTILYWFCSTLT